jgi:hypothetical protein
MKGSAAFPDETHHIPKLYDHAFCLGYGRMVHDISDSVVWHKNAGGPTVCMEAVSQATVDNVVLSILISRVINDSLVCRPAYFPWTKMMPSIVTCWDLIRSLVAKG